MDPQLDEFPQGTRELGRYDFYTGRAGVRAYRCYIHEKRKNALDVAIADVLDLGKGCYDRSKDKISKLPGKGRGTFVQNVLDVTIPRL